MTNVMSLIQGVTKSVYNTNQKKIKQNKERQNKKILLRAEYLVLGM